MFVFEMKLSFHRVEQVNPEPKVASLGAQKELEFPASSEILRDTRDYPDNHAEYNDGSPVPHLEKDDMRARRTGSYQKPSENQFNAFLPKPGGVEGKKKPLSGQYLSNHKTSGQEKKDTQERLDTLRTGVCMNVVFKQTNPVAFV